MLSWFTKPKVEIDTVVAQPTPLEQYEQNRAELRVLDQQLRAAERTIIEHIGVGKDQETNSFRLVSDGFVHRSRTITRTISAQRTGAGPGPKTGNIWQEIDVSSGKNVREVVYVLRSLRTYLGG